MTVKKKHFLILSVIFALVIVAFILNRSKIRMGNLAIQLRRLDLVAAKSKEWNQGAFVSPEFSGAVTATIGNTTNVVSRANPPVYLSLATELDSTKIEKLNGTVTAFFETFGDTNLDFDKYLQYKTESRMYHFQLGGIIGEIVKNSHIQIPSDLPLYDKSKIIWDACTADDEHILGGQRPVIKGVDLDTIKIWIYKGTNTTFAAGGLSLRTLNNLSKASINTMISYDNSPDKIVNSDGTFTYVALGTICRFNTSTNAGPLILGFYWSPKDSNWMPWELVTDSSSRYYTLY
jgi:hypothetical protein